MTPDERQQFFDREGYWPMAEIRIRPLSARQQKLADAQKLQASLRHSLLKGWRAPLHWMVPQAFKHPGLVYEELGHEEFLKAVEDYYAAIREAHVVEAQRVHTKWAIRQILRTFETHVRGFRGQSVGASSQYGRKGAVRYFASGQEKWGPEHRPHYQDILTLPEKLAEDGRLVHDLDGYLEAYGVSAASRETAAALVKATLEKTWGVKI